MVFSRCAAAIVQRNQFFHLYQQNKSCESKVKFREASNHCKRLLESVKLAYANKMKKSITSKKLDSRDSRQIADIVLNKGKCTIRPLFNDLVVLSSASDKAKLSKTCSYKTFLRTLILITQVSLYLFFLELELI